MTKVTGLLLMALICVGAALAIGGMDVIARTFMAAGMPGMASRLFTDDADKGIAAYRAGHYEAAALHFHEAGEDWNFNRANALALQGEYAESLIVLDAILAENPDDQAALFNHALVASVFAGTRIDGVPIPMEIKDRENEPVAAPAGMGTARAQGTGSEANNLGTSFETPQMAESGLRRVSRTFDDKYIAASDRWVRTLEDEPAVYLRARLNAERKRRKKEGTAPEPASDPQ